MKFKLPRQIVDQDVRKVIAREVRRQKIAVLRLSDKHLKELSEVSCAIKDHGLPKKFVRKKLPNSLGHGIFLHPEAEPLLKGQVIAPYSGKTLLIPQNIADDSLYAFEPLANILLTKQEQGHFDSKRKYHPRRLYSLHIDALNTGNFTRFINHSEKPNVEAELVRIPPNIYGISEAPLEVIYFVKKTIKPGEQLLVSYDGDDHSYWSALEIKPFPLFPKTFFLSKGKNSLQVQ